MKNKETVVRKENSKDRMKGLTRNESMRGSWLRHQGNYWDIVQLQDTDGGGSVAFNRGRTRTRSSKTFEMRCTKRTGKTEK